MTSGLHATLVLFLAVTGLRIGEAVAVNLSDIEGNVLHVSRPIYERQVDTIKTATAARRLPPRHSG